MATFSELQLNIIERFAIDYLLNRVYCPDATVYSYEKERKDEFGEIIDYDICVEDTARAKEEPIDWERIKASTLISSAIGLKMKESVDVLVTLEITWESSRASNNSKEEKTLVVTVAFDDDEQLRLYVAQVAE